MSIKPDAVADPPRKIGRPSKGGRFRKVAIMIRVTDAERAAILVAQNSARHRCTSDYIRRVVLDDAQKQGKPT